MGDDDLNYHSVTAENAFAVRLPAPFAPAIPLYDGVALCRFLDPSGYFRGFLFRLEWLPVERRVECPTNMVVNNQVHGCPLTSVFQVKSNQRTARGRKLPRQTAHQASPRTKYSLNLKDALKLSMPPGAADRADLSFRGIAMSGYGVTCHLLTRKGS